RARGALTAAVALAFAGVALAAAPAAPQLRAAHWLSPTADLTTALGGEPGECLSARLTHEQARSVEIGRAAVRPPMLLGGQAARAGLSCASCHRNGRSNPDFQFPGVSGAPGTADVTTSLLSSHRGDGVDNPRPIPDLGASKSALKVSQDPGSGALERFIHGL